MPDTPPDGPPAPGPPGDTPGTGAGPAAASAAGHAPDPRWAPGTVAVAAGRPARTPDAPVNAPLVLSSTYVGHGPPDPGTRGYARSGNPTWEAFEDVLSRLEGVAPESGGGALLMASGMAAVSAVVEQVPVGGRVVAPRSAYNTTVEVLGELAAAGRLRVELVDVADTPAVEAALDAEPTALLWLESPTNPLLEVADLAACASAGHRSGALVAVDGTFATPLVQRPLEHGADVVVHSVTKALAGHSDVVLGAVVTADPALLSRLGAHRRVHGAIPGPFEAWLALRGLRTLALRVERSQGSAAELARRLAAHPAVARVRHPSLPEDPGHARARAQMRGFGAVLSVELAAPDEQTAAARADALVEAVALWTPATSLGGVESLLERRRRHANEPTTTPPGLVRMAVGIEDVEDLWSDLEQALGRAQQVGPAGG